MAEGGALLRRYTGKTRIEGSNPSLSATRPCKIVLAALLGGAALCAGAAGTAETALLVVERSNAFRESQGLAPVRADAALTDAARGFAAYMAKTGKYGHGADGRQPPQRAAAAGYDYCIVSENIARHYRSAGYGSAEALAGELVEGWKNSPPHRKNMVDPAVTQIGVGLAQDAGGRYFAVQMFGRPKSEAIRFSLRNRSGGKMEYRLGGERYSLPPKASRTHTMCRAAELAIGGGFTAQTADGASYTVGQGGRVRVGQ